MAEAPKINIEQEFPAAVRAVGGEVVEDLVPAGARTFDNADYLFRRFGVVAELKCLDKNVVADLDFLAKLGRLYRKLMDEGRPPVIFGRGRVSLEQISRFDERAVLELLEPYKQRLGRVVKKANKQIEETAAYFGIQNPKGMLVLANDGERGYEFDLVCHLLFRLFKNCYSKIKTVLYFTANLSVNVPGFHPAAQVWAPLEIPNRPMVDQELLKVLMEAWMNHTATLTGGPVMAREVTAGDEIDAFGIRFTDPVLPKLDLR
jgi:hypothetical protein